MELRNDPYLRLLEEESALAKSSKEATKALRRAIVACENYPTFFVQGETIRGEPRVYWVQDRQGNVYSNRTRDRRRVERQCEKMLRTHGQSLNKK